MKNLLLGLVFILLLSTNAFGSSRKITVEKSSEIERELNFSLTIVDKYIDWRDQGLDKVFSIEGLSDEFVVKFQAPIEGKLIDVFGVNLTIMKGNNFLVNVPVEMKSKFSTKEKIDLQFRVDKSRINDAFITLRCGNPLVEVMYKINLKDYLIKSSRKKGDNHLLGNTQ